MYAQFGNIIFDNLFDLTGLSIESGTKLIEIPRIDAKARLQHNGPELETVTFSTELHAAFVDVQQTIDTLQNYRKGAEVHTFVLGNGLIIGKFAIATITETVVKLKPDGEKLISSISVELKEYFTDNPLSDDAIAAQNAAFALSENNPALIREPLTVPTELAATSQMFATSRSDSLASIDFTDKAAKVPAQKDSFLQRAKVQLDKGIAAAESGIENVQNNPKYGLKSPGLQVAASDVVSAQKDLRDAAKNGDLTNAISASKALSVRLAVLDKSLVPVNIILMARSNL